MVATASTMLPLGTKAPPFALPNVLNDTSVQIEENGSPAHLIAFICNHCPYVKAVIDRLVRDAKALEAYGVATVAICSNDATTHPEDSFEKMKDFAARHDFSFPYLHDADQSVAKAYGAVCTPDFFGFNGDLELQYRGRIDDARKASAGEAVRRDLFEAMRQVAETGEGPREQIPSMGCSIKWKDAA